MDWIKRRAGTVLGLSLFAMLSWSVAVVASMPSTALDSRRRGTAAGDGYAVQEDLLGGPRVL